ncbi:jerky protein homolog-like [Centruroides sculpturatus]|uniref:jerky protein homolog-like n=1 Tax=Centruroides sculpturatus TaxID=218467 RepID=UPI000C6E330B|nr:jerky protein homolog-like [Centruroides sculpturatus]
MLNSGKRKHKTLTLRVKAEIIKKIDKGEKLTDLAKYYDVGRATIHDIKKNRDKIECYVNSSNFGSGDRQTLKSGDYPEVEEALYAWFLQQRNKHAPISGEIIRKKAKYFYKQITNKDDFRASEGWLTNFKKRHGIHFLSVTGDKLSSCDYAAVPPFVKKFQDKIDELGLVPDQVYSISESDLFWRLFSQNTLVCQAGEDVLRNKMSEDQITFMCCSNASGAHKLELLVIGKAKIPRAFKNANLPVIYKFQNCGCITQEVFTEWFHENFVSSVKKFLKKQNLPQKALLILDNVPGHSNEDNLQSRDDFVQVMFLPSNCNSILQPMDQNVIQLVKYHYKRNLLFNVISQNDNIIKFLKEMNLKNVVFNIAYAWQNVSPDTIISSWKRLWPSHPLISSRSKITESAERDNTVLNSDLQEAIAELCERVNISSETTSVNEVNNWLAGSDEENLQITIDEETINNMKEDDNTQDENMTDTMRNVHLEHCKEILSAFNTCLKWAEESNVKMEDIFTLKRLQEKAVMESFSVKRTKNA